MLKKTINYYYKLGGSLKDREDGSEIRRILRLVNTIEYPDSILIEEHKPKRGKRRTKSKSAKSQATFELHSKFSTTQTSSFNLYREEELMTSIGQFDRLLDATRRFSVGAADPAGRAGSASSPHPRDRRVQAESLQRRLVRP
jgi:hypothetical protein